MEYLDKAGTQELINKLVEYIDDYSGNGSATNNPFLNSVYPVGAMYFTTNTDFDPSVTFGGTWERVEDKFIMLAGSKYTAGSTGGSDTHTLTIEEMPYHTHTVTVGTYGSGTFNSAIIGTSAIKSSSTTTLTTTGAGGSEPFSIVPSYLGIIGWRRTK